MFCGTSVVSASATFTMPSRCHFLGGNGSDRICRSHVRQLDARTSDLNLAQLQIIVRRRWRRRQRASEDHNNIAAPPSAAATGARANDAHAAFLNTLSPPKNCSNSATATIRWPNPGDLPAKAQQLACRRSRGSFRQTQSALKGLCKAGSARHAPIWCTHQRSAVAVMLRAPELDYFRTA